MNEQLYKKVMQGKRVTYVPYVEPVIEPKIVNLSDRQYLTIAGGLGVTLLMLMERFIPPEKRNHRKIKKVREAVHDLYAGSGQAVDPEILDWILACWDRTMLMAEGVQQKL